MDFSEIAGDYDIWYKTPFGAYADELEKRLVFEFAGSVKKKHLLDVGCGTGSYSIAFSKQRAKVVAVDSSIEMLSAAKEKIEKEGRNINLIWASAESLPFKNQSFDIITSITSLCFVESPDEAVKEMKRTVKGGGRIVVGVLNKWSFYSLEKRISSRFNDSIWRSARFFNIFELKGLLDEGIWRSTLFALPWMPSRVLKLFFKLEDLFSIIFKPFGAFIGIAQIKRPIKPSRFHIR